jgi:hypothetical protein
MIAFLLITECQEVSARYESLPIIHNIVIQYNIHSKMPQNLPRYTVWMVRRYTVSMDGRSIYHHMIYHVEVVSCMRARDCFVLRASQYHYHRSTSI